MSKKLSFSIAVNLLTENFKKSVNTVKNGFRSIQMQIVTFAAALGAGGIGLSGLLTRFRDVARETSRVLTALKNVSDGTKGFADNLSFLNDLAKKYGLEINALTGNFAKFTASATQANMPMEQQKKIFESVSRAITAFGLSASESDGVMLALSQMMSKGKLSMEELRKQMGEKLPIAIQAMAKALGVSIGQMEKLIGSGKVMSADVLPKFANALNEMIPNVDTDNLETSLSRLSNMFGDIVNASGFQNKYKALIDGLTSLLESASKNIQNIIVGIVAAIVFVVTNGLTKVYRSYAATGEQIVANAQTVRNKMIASAQSRIAAENKLEELKLQHAQATGAKQIQLANQIEKQKQLVSARTVATNKLHEQAKALNAQISAAKANTAWGKAYLGMRVAANKLMVSIKSMWNTFAPAIVISGLIALGGYIKNLYDKTKWLEKATEDYNKDLATEQININILFNRLRKATEGTELYKKTKEEIISKYGEYLKGLSDEVKSLKDVEGAYKAISAAALQSAKDRAIEKNSTNAYDKYTSSFAENSTELQKRLSDKFGKEKGTAIYDDILKSLNEDTDLPKDIQKVIDGFNKTYYGSSATGGGSTSHNPVGQLVNNIRVSKRQLNEELEGIKSAFGETSILKTEDNKTETFDPLNVQIENARKNVEDLKKSLANLQSGKTQSKDYAEDIESTTKALKEAQDKLSYLTTGKSYSSSGENKAQQAAEKRFEALRKLDEEDRKRQIEKQKFDLDLQQKAIDTMDDSFEKRTKQTLLNLEKEKLAIEEFQSDMLKDQQEHLKTKFESTHGTDKGFEAYFADLKKKDFKGKDGISILPEGLRPEDIGKQVSLLLEAARKAQGKGLADINKDLSAMLREQELMFASDLDKKLYDLDTYYNEQRIKAGNNAELINQIESNRKRAKQEVTINDKLQQLDFKEQLEIERAAGMESIGMTELVEEKKLEITKRYLQLKINALDKLAFAGDEEAFKQMQLLQASLKKLDTQKPVKSLKSLADKAIFDTIKKGFEKAGDSAEEAEEKTTSLLSSISHKASIIANITSELQSMFGGMDEGLDMALETVGNIAQGFASGGIVGGAMAVIGEGMKLFSKASEAAARHQKALEEIAAARLASQRAYNLLLREQNLLLEEAVSIFGEKQITRAANAIKEYREILKDLEDAKQGDFKPDTAYEQYLKKGASSGGIMGAYFGKQLNDYRKKVDNYNKGIAGLANATIVTGHKKTGLFGWGKGKDIYSSILDEYDDILDKEGKLNIARIQNILDTRKMSDETRNYLQNLVDLQDAAKAAQEELRNYLQSTFGVLGDDIMSSIENAILDKGVNAWEEFGKAGAKVIENLGKQLAYELFFAKKFAKLQEDLEAIYGSGKSEEDIAREAMALVGNFYQNIGKDMELAQGFMENWQKEAEKYGLNLWQPDQSYTQDSSKGYSVNMDQDTGGAILGRVTGLHETGLRMESLLSGISMSTTNIFSQIAPINNELKKQTVILDEINQKQSKSYFHLEEINETLKGAVTKLDKIDKNTKNL
ncbi:MAG: tape measure protein [Bacteroides xylanisolvens]